MGALMWILLSTFFISLLSFIGVFALGLKEKLLDKLLLILVSLSAGALMGGAFLHLIPEATQQCNVFDTGIYVLAGFTLFLFVEKFLHWRHCHKERCEIHTFAYMNLIGDSIHNFIDGLIIAASFVTNIPLGLTTTLAVAMHEIPQEIGDFGVLVYGKMTKKKALLLNFLTAVTAILGGAVGYFIAGVAGAFIPFLLPIAAGGFIYIAATDLLPEIKKEIELSKIISTFGVFFLGILLMFAIKFVGVE